MATTFADLQAKAERHDVITFTKGWEYKVITAGECSGWCGTRDCVGHLDLVDAYGCGTKLSVFVDSNGRYH